MIDPDEIRADADLDPDPTTVAALQFLVTGYRSDGVDDASIHRKLLDMLRRQLPRADELDEGTLVAVLQRAVDAAMDDDA